MKDGKIIGPHLLLKKLVEDMKKYYPVQKYFLHENGYKAIRFFYGRWYTCIGDTLSPSEVNYTLPQDEQKVYELLGLPLPVVPLQIGDVCKWEGGAREYTITGIVGNTAFVEYKGQSYPYPVKDLLEKRIRTVQQTQPTSSMTIPTIFKVGDKVRIVKDLGYASSEYVGQTGTIARAHTSLKYPWMVSFPGKSDREYSAEEMELIEEPMTVLNDQKRYYLLGTPGQLEGFRKDWEAAGFKWGGDETSPITRGLVVDFAHEQGMCLRRSWRGTPDGTELSVVTHWQEMLDKAAVYKEKKDTKAPIKLAGYEVELKKEVLHIGCRRVDKKDALEMLNSLHKLNGVLGGEGFSVGIGELLQIREWLIKK